MKDLEKVKELVRLSNNIVFFGGAGVSTESNIPDFKSQDGIYSDKYSDYAPEEILSQDFFYSRTQDFYDFYRKKMIYREAIPNKAHCALSSLEESNKLKAIITQNIDGLHQKSGSKEVIELHGSVHRNTCITCGADYSLDFILEGEEVPKCSKCKGIVKPDVVLYGEGLNNKSIEKAINYIRDADILIVAGTSLTVYPAAGLIKYYSGDKLILINKTETNFDYKANYIFRDKVGDVMEEIIS